MAGEEPGDIAAAMFGSREAIGEALEVQPLPPEATRLGLPRNSIVALAVARPVTLYRLAKHDPPEPADFLSNLGKPKFRYTRESPIIHAGLSMVDTIDRAFERATRSPKIVAAVELVPNQDFYVARTFGPGHYTVWGDEHKLCAHAHVCATRS